MRGRTCFAWLVAGAVLCGVASFAGDAVDFGLRGGYQRFTEEDDGAFMGGAFLRLNWRSVIFTEGAVLYHTDDVGSAEVEFIPIQLSALLFFLRRDLDFAPYVLAGGGAYLTRSVQEDGSKSDTEVDLGWHLGLGLDYLFNDRIFFEVDLRYIWLDLDFEGETVSDKLTNYNNWLAAAGLGFRL